MSFTTYENHINAHITIHNNGCGQIRKRGGEHKQDTKAKYVEHNSYADAKQYGESTTLPVILCSFCKPVAGHNTTPDLMDAIFQDFASLLKTRFATNIHTTEDSVRYTYFAAMLQAGIQAHEVVQELPHPVLERKEVDTYIPNYQGDEYFMEFKYDRIPANTNVQNKTDRSGKFISDLLRLSIIEGDATRLFVYLTDREMNVYFSNPKNGYQQIYDELNQWMLITKEFMENRPKSAQKGYSTSPFAIESRLLHSSNVAEDVFLRIFEVRRVTD